MTDILRTLGAGNLIGLDKDDNLLLHGKNIITDARHTESRLASADRRTAAAGRRISTKQL